MTLDWPSKAKRPLQTLAFCVGVASIQFAFSPEQTYASSVAYSLCIGLFTWAIIDLGRGFFPSARETGWPSPFSAFVLVSTGILGGYLIGHSLGDLLCRSFGWYGNAPPIHPDTRLRNSILVTVMASLVGTFYFYSRHKSAYLLRQMSEARLKLLETQLEPHMLFNTLANLRALIVTDPDRAIQMLDRLNGYLRATLRGSRTDATSGTHTLANELARLRDYLELMAVRMGTRLSYGFDVPPGLQNHPLPPLLLQPLVENAIRHGLEPKVAGGRITVCARREAGHLMIEVADTGKGMPPNAPPSSASSDGGFGLHQVRERVASLPGGAGRVDVESVPGQGTTIRLQLPLIKTPTP